MLCPNNTYFEHFNSNDVNKITTWNLPIDGPARRTFAKNTKMTLIPYNPAKFVAPNSSVFAQFSKQIQTLGTAYITCPDIDKVNVINDIINQLYLWANMKIAINKTDLFYTIGIMLTLSKVQSDPDTPPSLKKLMTIYAWLTDNIKASLLYETHAACAYLLLGILTNNKDIINEALSAWTTIINNVLPTLKNKLQNFVSFLDISYVLNDLLLVMFVLNINNIQLLDSNQLNLLHALVNNYAAFTVKNVVFLTRQYGEYDPHHTLSWIVLYHRLFQWKFIVPENIQFFGENLAAMLTWKNSGFGGSTFFNFAT
jgi:hypothetical protein